MARPRTLEDCDDGPAAASHDDAADHGRTQGQIRPGDILGALTGEAGFGHEQVGKITVMDQSSYVAVSRDIARDGATAVGRQGEEQGCG